MAYVKLAKRYKQNFKEFKGYENGTIVCATHKILKYKVIAMKCNCCDNILLVDLCCGEILMNIEDFTYELYPCNIDYNQQPKEKYRGRNTSIPCEMIIRYCWNQGMRDRDIIDKVYYMDSDKKVKLINHATYYRYKKRLKLEVKNND